MAPAFDQQDEIFSSAFSILRQAISDHVFPAASVAVTQAGKLVALRALGNFVYADDVEGVPASSQRPQPGRNAGLQNLTITSATVFDLASVTKVVATTTMAMLLYERGLLELDAPIIGTLPEFLLDSTGKTDPHRHDVTFRMLLAHSSGLPAYEKLFLKADSREDFISAAFTVPLSIEPGTRAEYSDIGFIILGIALERIAGEQLDVFCQREIFGPLGMSNTMFSPPMEMLTRIAPTADEREEREETPGLAARGDTERIDAAPKSRTGFRNRIIQGEVQDENAFVLGGVAGHAGLFSTAEEIGRFANALLYGGIPILQPRTVALFTRRDTTPGSSRALGWDTPSSPSQSGQYFGANSYGHLGYTGTSLWIDPDRRLSITLLTNRTWPDCSNPAIKQIRPRFHDAVREGLQRLR